MSFNHGDRMCSHGLGFWFEQHPPQHSQVIIWGFFFPRRKQLQLVLEMAFVLRKMSFHIFQLNNYAGIYYDNSLGLPIAPLSNSQPCAKKCEHFQESQQEI